MKQTKTVNSIDEFNEGFIAYEKYIPVKVARDLKNEFMEYISKRFIEQETFSWNGIIFPLTKYYKFKRLV